jgi:hypothetical protein
MKLRVSRIVFSALAGALLLGPLAVASRASDDVSQIRDVPAFTKIRTQGAFTVNVTAGAPRSRVVVSGRPEVVGRVTTEVRDGELVVGMRDGHGLSGSSAKLEIALPELRSFANDGAGTIQISGVGAGDLALANAGTATIVASGRARELTIALDGTGKIDTTAVEARDVTVNSNGVGGVYVRASGSLTMNVNGVGEIRYAGNPAHVDSHVNGIGHIGPM